MWQACPCAPADGLEAGAKMALGHRATQSGQKIRAGETAAGAAQLSVWRLVNAIMLQLWVVYFVHVDHILMYLYIHIHCDHFLVL